jgi:hypothetical protein
MTCYHLARFVCLDAGSISKMIVFWHDRSLSREEAVCLPTAVVDCRSAQEAQFWILDDGVNGLDRRCVVVEEKAGSQRRKGVYPGLRWWQQVCWRRGRGLGLPVAQERDPLRALKVPARRNVGQLTIAVPAVLYVSKCCGMKACYCCPCVSQPNERTLVYLPCEQHSCLGTVI